MHPLAPCSLLNGAEPPASLSHFGAGCAEEGGCGGERRMVSVQIDGHFCSSEVSRPNLDLSLIMRWFPSPTCLLSFAPALRIREWAERGYLAGQNQ